MIVVSCLCVGCWCSFVLVCVVGVCRYCCSLVVVRCLLCVDVVLGCLSGVAVVCRCLLFLVCSFAVVCCWCVFLVRCVWSFVVFVAYLLVV